MDSGPSRRGGSTNGTTARCRGSTRPRRRRSTARTRSRSGAAATTSRRRRSPPTIRSSPATTRAMPALAPADLPLTECLKDTVARFLPYWHETIAPAIRAGQRVIVAAHGNSLRALVKYLDGVSDEDIVELNIPTGIPLVYELDADLKPIAQLLPRRPDRGGGGVAAQAGRQPGRASGQRLAARVPPGHGVAVAGTPPGPNQTRARPAARRNWRCCSTSRRLAAPTARVAPSCRRLHLALGAARGRRGPAPAVKASGVAVRPHARRCRLVWVPSDAPAGGRRWRRRQPAAQPPRRAEARGPRPSTVRPAPPVGCHADGVAAPRAGADAGAVGEPLAAGRGAPRRRARPAGAAAAAGTGPGTGAGDRRPRRPGKRPAEARESAGDGGEIGRRRAARQRRVVAASGARRHGRPTPPRRCGPASPAASDCRASSIATAACATAGSTRVTRSPARPRPAGAAAPHVSGDPCRHERSTSRCPSASPSTWTSVALAASH